MKVLVINCGSSSFKYQILEMPKGETLCSGLVERIGDAVGALTHKIYKNWEEKKYAFEQPFPDHTAGMRAVVKLLTDPEKGVIKDLSEITAVGHRTVQGGERFIKACVVGEEEKKAIRDLSPLAPLHNPANLQGIEVAQELFPNAPSVAVFDTEFHATMPPQSYIYAVPYEYYEKYGVRRYGFHGTSHQYVAETAAEFLGKKFEEFNCITCHLGNGCSMTAVKNGKSFDTSMGMTPLAGMVMGTRCGDIDPALHPYIMQNTGMDIKQLDAVLNKQSGLKGLCGMNDMRDIHSAREKGDKTAQLAFDVFSHRIRSYLGAYYAVLGRVDAVIFTAGIGENDNHCRAAVCKDLEHMGIAIDLEKNDKRSGDVRDISAPGAKVPVLIVPTNEELAIARATLRVLQK
ncbi:Acetate kinase [uncultured delta proteobacterium]|uniref:Acetate kinase n=1 Tax=uncultured delta proteobacterium TaxID=34034 RepID=A0A212K3L6_9DELT|nr:Acetate kinase [uncultured delta proteobacterium]